MSQVVVYGADWCEDTQHTREFLNKLNVAHDYVNIEADDAARAWVKQQNEGKEQKPTVKIVEEVLKVPTDEQLEEHLRSHRIIG